MLAVIILLICGVIKYQNIIENRDYLAKYICKGGIAQHYILVIESLSVYIYIYIYTLLLYILILSYSYVHSR